MVATSISTTISMQTVLATGTLRQENEAILRVLRLMDRAAAYLKDSRKINPFFFEEVVDFLQLFVVRDHHAKVGEILLPVLQEKEGEAELLSFTSICKDYVEEGQLIALMENGFQWYRVAKNPASGFLIDTFEQYTHLARRNILRETTLFMLADEKLSLVEQKELAGKFSELEHQRLYAGTPERLKELVNELERQAFHWD